MKANTFVAGLVVAIIALVGGFWFGNQRNFDALSKSNRRAECQNDVAARYQKTLAALITAAVNGEHVKVEGLAATLEQRAAQADRCDKLYPVE